MLFSVTKYSASSECSAFKVGALCGKKKKKRKAIKCVCFHHKRKYCFVKLQQLSRATALYKNSTAEEVDVLFSALYSKCSLLDDNETGL